MCVRGARWVQRSILEANPDADLRVYAVFMEIVAGDEGARTAVDPRTLLDDPRVTLYWDERQLTGRWFEQHVTKLGRDGDNRLEWDSWFLYDRSARWTDEKPPQVSWGRPIIEQKDRLEQDLNAVLKRSPRE